MAKKSFKDNPALQFITPPEPQTAKPAAESRQAAAPAKKRAPKKQQVTATRRAALPDRGPSFEAKSKRLNLLIRPSLFSDLSGIAQQKGVSNNDLIHRILEQAVLSGEAKKI